MASLPAPSTADFEGCTQEWSGTYPAGPAGAMKLKGSVRHRVSGESYGRSSAGRGWLVKFGNRGRRAMENLAGEVLEQRTRRARKSQPVKFWKRQRCVFSILALQCRETGAGADHLGVRPRNEKQG
jgi:hypothetical protein